MIEFVQGDMFAVPADIRVNTVNSVGVMGAGVALAFKQRYPEMFKDYQRACRDGLVRPGKLHVWRSLMGDWVVNFPTKRDWREPSRYEDIADGLDALREYLRPLGNVTVALPALGCGHGGLDWERVSKMIEQKLSDLSANLQVFTPSDSRRAGQKNLDSPSQEELLAVEHLGYTRVSISLDGVVGDSLFTKGRPDLLQRRWIALLPSRTSSERETRALDSVAAELSIRDRAVTVALVHSNRASESISDIFTGHGINVVLILPFGVLTRKSLAQPEHADGMGSVTLISAASPGAKWSRGLFAQAMELLRARASTVLLSDPSLDWFATRSNSTWRKVPAFYLRYDSIPDDIRAALDLTNASAIGRRPLTGAPNLDSLLAASHTNDLLPSGPAEATSTLKSTPSAPPSGPPAYPHQDQNEKTMTTFSDLLKELTEATRNNRDKGTQFEKLIANYLMADPQYADRLADVWLWSEWPDRSGSDVGIDLVARERGTGDFWAIQCKFYDPANSIQKADIDSFFTASGKRFPTKDGECGFSHRIIVSTTDKWSKHAEEALADQSIPVSRLWFKDLADSPIDWSQFSLANVKDIRLKPKKVIREHQAEAIGNIIAGFKEIDRGKLIMACGTGKTFTALRLMEQITPTNGRVLFLAPSISLVSQSLREWTAEALSPLHAFVVCSDTKVGRDEEDISTHDLAYPATTDAKKLSQAASVVSKDRRTVVFSTYQSIQVLADAQKQGFGEFDLIICDEAHRTTGLTLLGEDPSEFLKVHQNHIVRGQKRIYMTATPRIYGDASKTKANQAGAEIFSMDNEADFGREFYRLGFGKAVERDLLSEYKVLIVAVKESEMAKLANNFNNAYKIDEKKAVDIRFATKIVGSWKGLSKRGLVLVGEDGQEESLSEDTAPMRRAVAFSKSIKDSKQTTDIFTKLVGLYQQSHDGDGGTGMVACTLDHVDGTMNALVRQSALEWLKADIGDGNCRILSNARCLSEGIDVPALDAVVFFDTRESIVDIVQSVGRVMRKAEGKKYGYIILPVCIPSEKVKDYNNYVDSDPQFKGIWKVIKALRAHDESLVDEAEFRRKIKVIGDGDGKKGDDGKRGEDGLLPLDFPMLPLDAVNEAVYAAIPKKLGDREYWSEWAKSIGQVAERLIARIKSLIATDAGMAKEFAIFLKGLQDTLNPAVSADEAIEMLAQHILTLPVFQALFAGSEFPDNNAVAKALQVIVTKLDAAAVASETEGLDKFYENVSERISLAKSDKSKQDIVRNLYDTFFNNAFPRMAERLGIVYTPVELVDFILRSVQVALQTHFQSNIGDRDVQVLDPFSGTGTFLVRLIQSGLIDTASLPHKFENELHANEIVLLAYYIATVNIETAFHAQTGSYRPFNGMVLTDTFQMTEESDLVDRVVLPENNAKAERQLAQPIRVIVGNPPYSAQQDSENDNNKNLDYPTLDARIRNTYAAQSGAKLVKNLYDSYIRAIRWASDRIGDRGIVAFVTNGSFLEANNMDGLRKCLTDDYSHLYIFNLRGNQRTSGEASRLEGGKIFGSGSRTPVAISIMVKDPAHTAPCELRYHDIGDYLSREEKLAIIEDFGSTANIEWQQLAPNTAGDWINQRDPAFDKFMPLGDKESDASQSIFSVFSLGVSTNRDAWVYNLGRDALSSNMRNMIANYNRQVDIYAKACKGLAKDQWPKILNIVETDPKKISWSSSLLPDAARGRKAEFSPDAIVKSIYRPYSKQWLYFDGMLNDRQGKSPLFFPSPKHRNVVIFATGIGASKPFSALVADCVPNLHLHDTGQCFPLYWYEKLDESAKPQGEMFGAAGTPDADGYIRRDAITDWALGAFRQHYRDPSIGKDDIFCYVYGVLHSPEYKQRFASDLKKMLPRIPLAKDFRAFCDAGRKLGDWHLYYETADPFPLTEESKRLVMEDGDYRVVKMAFGKKEGKADKSVIFYNEHLTLRDIPLEAYDYVVNGKPAIEWIMERYQVTTDKASSIKNDPNEWSEDPRYIVDLLKRIVRVSVESARIVKTLPALKEAK